MAYPKGYRLHTKCSVETCSSSHRLKLGLCSKHYFRQRRYGDTNSVLRVVGDNRKRFYSKVNKDGPTQPHMSTPCWIWTGPPRKDQYGQIRVDRKYVLAHRYSFFIDSGRFAKPMTLHRCDNKICVRPDHLYEGTHSDNMNDRKLRGKENQYR